jgi:hypothetical protein
MHDFDSRGVYTVFAVSPSDGTWTFPRDAPGFSQRFTGTFSDDGNTVTGRLELSEDGSTWAGDSRLPMEELRRSLRPLQPVRRDSIARTRHYSAVLAIGMWS